MAVVVDDHVVGAVGVLPITMDLIGVQADSPFVSSLVALTLKKYSVPLVNPVISAWYTVDLTDVDWT